jgi:hypothetical protein
MMLIKCRYAHKHGSPLVFCYDAKFLLLIQFQARTVNDIKSTDCSIDLMLVPRHSLGGCTIRDAFYRFATQGIRRRLGLEADALLIQGYPRSFEYYSGRPYWTTAQGRQWNHPLGYQREFDVNALRWKWVLNEDEVWDTYSYH